MGENPDSKRTVLVTALALLLLISGTCVGGAYWGLRRVGEAMVGSAEWTHDAVPRTQVAPLFGVALPDSVLDYRSRAMGFQGWSYEVLLRVPPADKERWLSANHLSAAAGALAADLDDVEEEIRRASAPRGTARITALEELLDDAGAPAARRRATLLEYPDQCWVYLDTFER